jgi:NAD(P)-dependent dehydrogenase (short-subunit alcohol dehydrogenase family)
MAQNFFIAGATSGIGKATAFLLASRGSRIVGFGKTPEKIRTLQEELGPEHSIFEWDLMKPFDRLPPQALGGEKFDGAVFSAGVSSLAPVAVCPSSEVESSLRINFLSVYETVRQLILEKRVNEGASFVFVSSMAAEHPSRGQLAYSASKICLESMVKVLVQEFSARKKWRFNLISPGQLRSPMLEKAVQTLGPEKLEEHRKVYPLGFGEIQDAANAIAYLLNREVSGFVNGADLRLDGGAGLVTPF